MSLRGSIAVSTAGRDRNKVFIIVGVLDEKYVLIANGKSRKIEKPKKKKLMVPLYTRKYQRMKLPGS